MSRFEWDGDYDGPGFQNAGDFFDTRARWAIYGRRGRRQLAELREALLALPRHELIEGAMRRGPREDDEDPDDDLPKYSESLPEAWLTQRPAPPDQIPVAPGQMSMFVRVPEAAPAIALTGQHLLLDQYRVCAVGAYSWWKKVRSGMDPVKAFEALPALETEDDNAEGGEMFETAWEGERAGLTYALAWELASGNDETFSKATPAERWQKFVDWIDGVLATPLLKRGEMPPKRLGHSWSI